MDVIHPRCAGIDIHKRTVVACRIVLTDDGEWLREAAEKLGRHRA